MEQINIATLLKDYNPYHFGSITGASPYIVIKPEKDPLARGTVFRIILHDDPNQLLRIETHMQEILAILATDDKLQTQSEDFDPTITTNNDDGTISREHTFLMFSKY